MGRFLTNNDYNSIVRSEILEILIEYSGNPDENIDDSEKLLRAEDMAIAQLRNYLSGRYDVTVVFSATEADRNAYIIMIAIDCTLYHLYSALSPDKIPSIRSERYQDALNWLKDVANGNIKADLPRYVANGSEKFDFRISSERTNEDNKW